MFVSDLTVHHFRNLEETTVSFGHRQNLIYGQNAQGKTNILEAVCLAVGQSSFRASRIEEMVAFGQQRAKIRAMLCLGEEKYDVSVDLAAGERRYQIDGKTKKVDATQGFGAVLFTPDDLVIPRGSPSQRRRLLDDAITIVWPRYGDLAGDYQRVIRNRNRLCKEQQGDLHNLLDVYDEQLSVLGAKLIQTRVRFLKQFESSLLHAFCEITGNKESLNVVYEGETEFVPTDDVEAMTVELRKLLQQSRAIDLIRGITTKGPHTHDLQFFINDKSVRDYASQGQSRSVMLAFRLGQVFNYRKIHDFFPILLLDDVSSELDAERNSQLFEIILDLECQLLVTTTRQELIPVFNNSKQYRIVNGHIEH